MVQLIRSASRSVWNFEFGAMFCSNNSGHGILELCKAISAKQLAFLPVKADEAAAKSCQDLRLLNSLSGLQVAFCGVKFAKFIFHNIFCRGFYALEILRLKICFAILIPRLEKEQNPCSAGGFMMISLFPTTLCGVLVFDSVSRAPSPPPPASLHIQQ